MSDTIQTIVKTIQEQLDELKAMIDNPEKIDLGTYIEPLDDVVPAEAKEECKFCQSTGKVYTNILGETIFDICEDCSGHGFIIKGNTKKDKCKYCKNLDEMYWEFPDDPHHGEVAECEECQAEFYRAYEQDIKACNEQALIAHPELKSI